MSGFESTRMTSATMERLRAIRALQAAGRSFDFEGMLERHYRRFLKRGDGVFDVGAHTGRHLACFIDCVGPDGRVVAFEPLPFAFAHLRRHFERPGVTLKNVALSESDGVIPFVFAEGSPEESGLRQRVYNLPEQAKPRAIEVATERLDRYVDAVENLKYVKIDVEGGEMNVLNGGVEVLARRRPLVSVEYGHPGYSVYGHSLYTLFDFAEHHGYVLYDIFANRLGRVEWPHSCDAICWDFFMVPVEKEDDFAHAVPPVPID